MKPLFILMWKHWNVKKRHIKETSLELIVCFVCYLALFFLKDSGMMNNAKTYVDIFNIPIGPKTMSDNSKSSEPLSAPSAIVYAPANDNTSQLMAAVVKEFCLRRLSALPAPITRGYVGVKNLTLLEDFMKNMSESQAIVLFRMTDFPKTLNYTIRIKADYENEPQMSADDLQGYGIHNDIFPRLQWAIDKSFIQMRSGMPINQKMLLQAFPPPKSSEHWKTARGVASYMGLIVYLALILPYIHLCVRLIVERASGEQELIKLGGVSQMTINVSHYLNQLPTACMFCLFGPILLKITSNPALPNTSYFLIFLAMLLHFTVIMIYSILVSFLKKDKQYADLLALISYMIANFIPKNVCLSVKNYTRVSLLFTGIFPYQPIFWFWTEVQFLESTGKGVDFSTWTESHTNRSGSALESILILFLQICFLTMLIWYLSHVCPGAYGVSEQPRSSCCRRKAVPRNIFSNNDTSFRDPRHFEEPYRDKAVGIKILNVTKGAVVCHGDDTFYRGRSRQIVIVDGNTVLCDGKIVGKKRLLSDVTFDVYYGEITVLLGHNGAGKSTLMSIITGTRSVTSGKVYIAGLDLSTEMHRVRQILGVCTQSNIFVDYLNVRENVMLFCLLKGQTFKDSRISTNKLLKELRLFDKAYAHCADLSGGMKRRLQLACALAGDSSILILDEPTTGLDVENRRELWDLLMSLRRNRTVLLTTHFMEEADALGDRVATLHKGVLRGYATPMHLKKNIGAGYHMTLHTQGLPMEDEITAIINSFVPDATIADISFGNLSYNLPTTNSKVLSELFTMLEAKTTELEIESMKLGMSTLEEVFVALCSNMSTSFTFEEMNSSLEERVFERITGCSLYCRQIRALLKRNVLFLLASKSSFLFLQILLPVLSVLMTSFTLYSLKLPQQNKVSLMAVDLDFYRNMSERRVYFKVQDKRALKSLARRFNKVQFIQTRDVTDAVLQTSKKNVKEYNKYLAGIELNDTNAKVLYSTTVQHAAPAAVNLLSNLLADSWTPWQGGHTIATYNHPVFRPLQEKMAHAINIKTMVLWSAFMSMISMMTIMNTVTLLCQEMEAGTRHIHIMAGCPSVLHWFTRLLFHAVLYSTILTLPIVTSCAALDLTGTMRGPEVTSMSCFVLFISLLTNLSFIYLLTFFCSEHTVKSCLGFFAIFGTFWGAVSTYLEWSGIQNFIIDLVKYTIPAATMSTALVKTCNVARINSLCDFNRDRCPLLHNIIGSKYVEKCCVQAVHPVGYFDLDTASPLLAIFMLLTQFTVFMTMVVLRENGLFVYNRELIGFKQSPTLCNDFTVRQEKYYVQNVARKDRKQIPDVLLVNDVHKSFTSVKCCRCNPIAAVKGVSFCVKRGECLGLLGANGAGKSTMFKMIVAETTPTHGSIFANRRHMKYPLDKYLRALGYCPEILGLDDFLSGKENLRILLTMHGLKSIDIMNEVDEWIHIVGLDQYKHRRVSEYSSGCKRRMATAVALSCGAPLTLLDEPTSGVDLTARYRVMNAVRRGLRHNRSIVITSQSFGEIEALCGRIAIMVSGELCALGSPAELRARHAQGHCVRFKLNYEATNNVMIRWDPVISLQRAIEARFKSKLQDEHSTMLNYHIEDEIPYSELFNKLEDLKVAYPGIIEDYTVSATTLEEVYLAFTRNINQQRY